MALSHSPTSCSVATAVVLRRTRRRCCLRCSFSAGCGAGVWTFFERGKDKSRRGQAGGGREVLRRRREEATSQGDAPPEEASHHAQDVVLHLGRRGPRDLVVRENLHIVRIFSSGSDPVQLDSKVQTKHP